MVFSVTVQYVIEAMQNASPAEIIGLDHHQKNCEMHYEFQDWHLQNL